MSTLTSSAKYHKRPEALRSSAWFLLTLVSTCPVTGGGEDRLALEDQASRNAGRSGVNAEQLRLVNYDARLAWALDLPTAYFDLKRWSPITSTIGATQMVLPSGVRFYPRETSLLAKDSRAVIEIETGNNHPHNAGYQLSLRAFEQTIVPYFNEEWREFARSFGLHAGGLMEIDGTMREVAYVGAEHTGDPKLPNITIVPNFVTDGPDNSAQTWTVLGSTMGHQHVGGDDTPRVQEVYEFQSYGMMVICKPSGAVELWIARAGDKVAVPNDCKMTLYNLGDRDNPLITLDFANPGLNAADKNVIKESGPVLLAYYNDFEAVFSLNGYYLHPSHGSSARVEENSSAEQTQIRIGRGGRSVLGPTLYERLSSDPEIIGQFARLGVAIKRATNQATLLRETDPPFRLYFSSPLAVSASPGSDVHRYFFPQTDTVEPAPAKASIAEVAAKAAREKAKLILNSRLNRGDSSTYEIVIEGVGDWVEKTYRPLIKQIHEELNERKARGERVRYKRLHAVYANDSRWKDPPAWTDHLEEWETYLDKANAEDMKAYRFNSSDVVFIATPDSTHSEIAQDWLWRSPMVFVEKPFDSDLKNVHDLMKALGRGPDPLNPALYCDTKILGLDHYQFYALSISRLSTAIENHLDGAIAEVRFFLTENRAIEYHRDRSLQHGLTLDLLPHFLALLTYFGDVRTVDEIEVIEAGQYVPLDAISRDQTERESIAERFHNETWSRLRFTFQDYSGNGHHVPCRAVVGKGFAREVKFLEVKGRNGNSIRLDLCEFAEIAEYPVNSLFFLANQEFPNEFPLEIYEVEDPYDDGALLRILRDVQEPGRFRGRVFRERYAELVSDLMNGTGAAAASTLSLTESESIVSALDRIWWAVQDKKPFELADLKTLRAI